MTDGGADVLKEAQPYAQDMIDAFNQIGTPAAAPVTAKGHAGTTTTTTVPTEAHGNVDVNVLNASSNVSDLARSTATALTAQGFTVTQIADASSPLAAGAPSEILYGPSGYEAALTLDSVLSGPVTYVSDSSLSGQTVTLMVAGSELTVTGGAGAGASTTTTATGGSTTTTTIPSDVYTNTQSEPWNPVPCTLGQSTQASPSTTTTLKKR